MSRGERRLSSNCGLSTPDQTVSPDNSPPPIRQRVYLSLRLFRSDVFSSVAVHTVHWVSLVTTKGPEVRPRTKGGCSYRTTSRRRFGDSVVTTFRCRKKDDSLVFGPRQHTLMSEERPILKSR